ncbi:MAG: signal peptidase I [Pseudomonadota bacterium]
MARKNVFLEYFEALIIAFLLAMFIRTFIVQAYKIPSGSMLETMQIGDHLLVNKFAYGVKIPFTNTYMWEGSDPEVGDVIVFEYPKNPSIDYIKRVVGVPGDVIEVHNKQLYRNGQKVTEDYIQHSQPDVVALVRDEFGPVTVPEGKYFAMGDNRDDSQDSRFWGFVDKSAIHGKAWIIYWSWNDGVKGAGDDSGSVRWDRILKSVH